MQAKVYEYVHSVRIELAKLILVGTRIIYQATGDAGMPAYRLLTVLVPVTRFYIYQFKHDSKT